MKGTFWARVIIAVVGLGTVAIGIAFALDIQNFSGFLWELPVILIVGGITAGAAAAVGIQQSNRPRLSALCIVASQVIWIVFVLGMFNIDFPFTDRWYGKLLGTIATATCILAFWSCAALAIWSLDAHGRFMRYLCRGVLIVCTLLAAMWFAYYINDTYLPWGDTFFRPALTLTSVAALAAVLCLPAGVLWSRAVNGVSQPMRIATVSCPRCGSLCSSADQDTCTCETCRLPIQLDRREPRCACGYLLMNLNGTTCPECGKSFRARIRYELTSV